MRGGDSRAEGDFRCCRGFVLIFSPPGDQDGNGTHVNVSGAGLVKTAPNRDNAVKFLEYLTSENAQRFFADGNNEYPAAQGLKANSAVEQVWAHSSRHAQCRGKSGKGQAEAVRIFDRAAGTDGA